jgi:outer membrane cobalamin receptor
MKKIFLLIQLLLPLITWAHNGTLSGKVQDATSAQALEIAHLKLLNTNLEVITNEFGQYTFINIKPGNYTLQVNAIGYQVLNIPILFKDDEAIVQNFKLKKQAINLSEVKVASNHQFNLKTLSQLNIQKQPINSAQDILRAVPGLFIAQHAGGGKAEQIFLRGFDCDHGTDISLKVDGMPVNMVSHAHGQGYADLHFVIPETVDRIDINKGTYAASAGDFSTAGSIEFKTKNFLDKNVLQLEKGMFNNNRLLLMSNLLSNKLSNKHNWWTAGEYNFNRSYFDSPSDLNRINLFTKYNYNFDANNQLTIQGSYFNSFWSQSGQIPEREVLANNITEFGSIDKTEAGKTERVNLSATLKNVRKNNDVISHQIFYNKYKFKLYSNFTFFKNEAKRRSLYLRI